MATDTHGRLPWLDIAMDGKNRTTNMEINEELRE